MNRVECNDQRWAIFDIPRVYHLADIVQMPPWIGAAFMIV